MQLNDATLPRTDRSVGRPNYDREAVSVGIVHLGPGAFHRTHQAWFADRALAGNDKLGICAVSLRSDEIRDALQPQDWLYTLEIADRTPEYRIVGSIRNIMVAPEDPESVIAQLADPAIHTVTVTVTEKGYCLAADGGLDRRHPDIAHDLANPGRPTTVVGFLAAALGVRRSAGTRPFVVVSCDNLSDNGAKLGRAVVEFARQVDPDLAAWIDEQVFFPRTMVDSITPITDDALRERVHSAINLTDAWPVTRERFCQWVIEESPVPHRDDWANVGVIFTDDIAAFELAKLRVLNCQHSALAYLGIPAGFSTIREAVRDPALASFLDRLVNVEIKPTLRPLEGIDLNSYVASVNDRLRNPMIVHRLEQIAPDGSQKIPIRVFGTISENLEAGRPFRCLCMVIAAWLNFLDMRTVASLDDPLSEDMLDLHGLLVGDTARGMEAFFESELVRQGGLPDEARVFDQLVAAYDCLRGARGNIVGERLTQYLDEGATP